MLSDCGRKLPPPHLLFYQKKKPWRKFRIVIHSEPIRTILNHSDICIRANVSQSEPIRKMFGILFVEKRLKINPTQFDSIWDFYPNESEVNLQSKWIRINPEMDWSEPNIQSEWVRINPYTDSFGLKINLCLDWLRFIRIENLLRISSDIVFWVLMKQHSTITIMRKFFFISL